MLKKLTAIVLIFSYNVSPANAETNVIKKGWNKVKLAKARHQLKENQEAIAEGEPEDVEPLDCSEFIDGDGFCLVHKSRDPEVCETIASGNWNERIGHWTKCQPAVDEQGNKLCLSHANPARPCPTPQICERAYTDKGTRCITHPDKDCFKPVLVCEFHHSHCGMMDPSSVEHRGDVPVADGTIAEKPNVFLGLLTRNTTPVVHTRYVWSKPISVTGEFRQMPDPRREQRTARR